MHLPVSLLYLDLKKQTMEKVKLWTKIVGRNLTELGCLSDVSLETEVSLYWEFHFLLSGCTFSTL